MTLSEAIAAFQHPADDAAASPAGSNEDSIALELFNTYCSLSAIRTSDELTGVRLRDFLGKWY
ncbi:MAG TPA: hypothetical protein VLD57_00705, partial [Blastocatellia bacterium]|nr:hypothetical protein [Blastocatellia bacterium]